MLTRELEEKAATAAGEVEVAIKNTVRQAWHCAVGQGPERVMVSAERCASAPSRAQALVPVSTRLGRAWAFRTDTVSAMAHS